MTPDLKWKSIAGAILLLSLAACGGGGGGASTGSGGTSNNAPNANAGADQTVDEQTGVTLDGTASSDPDGNNLTYNWSQTSGANVTIASANSAQATFDSPNVGIGSSTTLTFSLRVSDGNAIDTDTVSVVVNGVSNTDPVADAGPDQATTEAATVNLSATASDSDIGDTLSYSWTQLSGTAVTIENNDMADASFAAPVVGAGGDTLTLQLAVNDGTATVTDTMDVTVSEAAAAVTISGKVQYEFVPPNANCRGLNFSAIEIRPIRAATVQLIDDATGNVLDTVIAPGSGDYSFSNVAANLDVRIRVRAELKRTGSPAWDVEVRDNVDTSPTPPPLGSRPLYVYEETFNSGGADITRNVTARTGWDGSAYTGTRAAAPFAILDAIYTGMQFVITADANAVFAPMDAFWSVNNTRVPDQSNIDIGELTSTAYSPSRDSLFLLGDANVDTEEFDDYVVMHEWGHYFEDNFSRSDSIGGRHVFGSSLDARLAFGEGFATAFAAMALGDSQACNTQSPLATAGFRIDVENFDSGAQGWFNEGSVATFLYDLWDTDVDGTDADSIGFGPIYDTLIGPQKTTEAFTTVFSFAAELRPMLNAAQQSFFDSQLSRENIEAANIDIWASTQSNIMSSPNQARDVLPVYTDLPTDGSVINLCANSDYESGRDGNKLAEYRYLRFTTTMSAAYTVTITTTTPTPVTADPDDRDQSDPDMRIYLRGVQVVPAIGTGVSGDENREEFTTPTLAAATYVADLQEWRFADEDGAPASFPEQICFDVSMSPL